MQAELAPMHDEDDVKRLREENGHTNGHFQVHDVEAATSSRNSTLPGIPGIVLCFPADLPNLNFGV